MFTCVHLVHLCICTRESNNSTNLGNFNLISCTECILLSLRTCWPGSVVQDFLITDVRVDSARWLHNPRASGYPAQLYSLSGDTNSSSSHSMFFITAAMESALEHDTAGFLLLKLQPQLLLSPFVDTETSSPLLWFFVGLLLHVLGSRVLLPPAPTAVLGSSSRLWKWRNTYMARLAAAVTGAWALLSLYSSPEMRTDLMISSTNSASCLVAFSIGVHLAEAVDMVWNKQPGNLLIHHIFVILCFTGTLITSKAIGFAVLSLVTEVNSVFNKTRIIHVVSGVSRASDEFQKNARINVATFAIRMAIVAWMNHQSFLYFGILPLSFLLPCNLGLLFVNFWNISVFRQLVVADLVKKAKA